MATSVSTAGRWRALRDRHGDPLCRVVDSGVGEDARVEQVVLAQDGLVVEQPDDRRLDVGSVGDFEGNGVAQSGVDRGCLIGGHDHRVLDAAVEPAGLDVEVEQGVDLIEVEPDHAGHGAVDTGVEVRESGGRGDDVGLAELVYERGGEVDFVEIVGEVVVGFGRPLERRADRCLDGFADDECRGDECEADHQRRGRGGGATRVASGVLLREMSGDPGNLAHRPAEHGP